MGETHRPFTNGQWGEVAYVIRANGDAPAREFLEALCDQAQAQVLALFERMATHGQIRNSSRFSIEGGKIFGFKLSLQNRQARFPCFRVENRWIVTHGFFKPGAQKKLGKWPEAEFERAQRLMNEFYDAVRG